MTSHQLCYGAGDWLLRTREGREAGGSVTTRRIPVRCAGWQGKGKAGGWHRTAAKGKRIGRGISG